MRLLLLPGLDGTGLLFEPLVRALPPPLSARVVAYPPDLPLGYDGLLPLVEEAAAGGPFVVVGESFSGPLALMLAARCPPGLRGVVLCASFVRSPLPAPARWRAVVPPWMFRVQPLWLVSLVLLGWRGWGPLGRRLRRAVRSASPAALAARVRAVAGVDVTAELRGCHVPLLYLRASHDRVVRSGCWELVRAVRPDAGSAVLPGPHLILQTAPAESAAVVASFCARVAGPDQSKGTVGASRDGG